MRSTWAVMIPIFNICNMSFQGLWPLARCFSHGFMKKYLSLRLKSSTASGWSAGALHLPPCPLTLLPAALEANRSPMTLSPCVGERVWVCSDRIDQMCAGDKAATIPVIVMCDPTGFPACALCARFPRLFKNLCGVRTNCAETSYKNKKKTL